jgi:hypothetical protein
LNREWSTMLLAKALINDKDSLHKLSFLRLSTASKIQLNRRLCELVDDFARISRRDKMIHPNKDLYPTSMLVATITEGFLD